MKNELQKKVFEIVQKIWPDLKIDENEVEIGYAPEKFGDYSCNIAMKLAGKLKKSPIEIAEELKAELEKEKDRAIEKMEVVKPGFLNFHLSGAYFQGKIEEINNQKNNFGQLAIGEGKLVHLDFVSANPTGPIHLGNGRGGPMGDTLANILEKAGYKTHREYYVNDYGNQIKILGHSILKDEEAAYKGDYIDDLGEKIKEKDPFVVGQVASVIIVDEIITPTMERLGIKFDEYFSEKSLHDKGMVEEVFQELKNKNEGLIFEKDGATWFLATKFGDEKDRVIIKKTGEVTYFGGDIAYHKSKFDRGADMAIDIWGADHHGDVKRVMGAVEALGYKNKLKIILSQMVRVIKDGKEFRMSKRKGTFVTIDDLLGEVGKDAVRFFFLLHSANTHMDFDIDLAKEESNKNPVYYVQYAHARISSILGKAKEFDLSDKKEAKNKNVLLVHEKEKALTFHLQKFPELVAELSDSHEVHQLPHYAMEIADLFHSFYHDCKVLDKNNEGLSLARLELVKATKIVLSETLRLLGVDAPEKM